jgi:hypothetical protein
MVGRRRGLGQAGAQGGGTSLAQTWWADGLPGGDDVGEATRAVDSVMWWGKLILFAKSGQVRFANLR